MDEIDEFSSGTTRVKTSDFKKEMKKQVEENKRKSTWDEIKEIEEKRREELKPILEEIEKKKRNELEAENTIDEFLNEKLSARRQIDLITGEELEDDEDLTEIHEKPPKEGCSCGFSREIPKDGGYTKEDIDIETATPDKISKFLNDDEDFKPIYVEKNSLSTPESGHFCEKCNTYFGETSTEEVPIGVVNTEPYHVPSFLRRMNFPNINGSKGYSNGSNNFHRHHKELSKVITDLQEKVDDLLFFKRMVSLIYPKEYWCRLRKIVKKIIAQENKIKHYEAESKISKNKIEELEAKKYW